MKKAIFFIFSIFIIAGAVILIYDRDAESDAPTAESAEKLIDVPALCQYPALPTGCEATAAAMVLQFYGTNISPEEFAESWLVCSNDFAASENGLHGPDPNEVFAGNPFSESSFGCYAPVIVRAVNSNSAQCSAKRVTGSLDTLCKEFIDSGKPLLIWATMGMRKSGKGRSWKLENGSDFTWISGEHCLVLVGYNEKYYYLNDPQSGGTVCYEKAVVNERFGELGAQAVYIYRK